MSKAAVLVILALVPVLSTSLGGVLALRARRRLHPVMAFAAGVLVATALANLLPEGQDLLGQHGSAAPIVAVAGFVLYALLDVLGQGHHPEADEHGSASAAMGSYEGGAAPHPTIAGLVGPAVLVVHSTLDGVAIGLSFRTQESLGLLVGFAVMAHDLADGMNVVTLALTGGRGRRMATVALALDALAPAAGVLLGDRIPLEDALLGGLLAAFAGAFIAIGAGHLLPHARREGARRPWVTAVLLVVGAALALSVRALAG